MELIEKEDNEGDIGRLSEKITLEEVRRCIVKLKRGKAAGIDEIINELIKYGGEQVYTMMWQLLTLSFETEEVPEEWMKGIIFPIYKAGDERNPDNYRRWFCPWQNNCFPQFLMFLGCFFCPRSLPTVL